MNKEQITTMVNDRTETLRQEIEYRNERLAELVRLEDEVARLREELNIPSTDMTVTRHALKPDETSPAHLITMKRLQSDKEKMFGAVREMGDLIIRKKRFVDLDLGGGFNTYETLAISSVCGYRYLMHSRKSDKNQASRVDRSHESTTLYLFDENMHDPLCMSEDSYCTEPMTFRIGRAVVGRWWQVISLVDGIRVDASRDSTGYHDRWDECVVNVNRQSTPEISLI